MLDAGHRRPGHRHAHPHWTVGRVAFLAVSAICIYLFAPSIAEVFSAYDRLGQVHPVFLLPATLCALASFACVWLVQGIALGTRDWFSVITTQLAGNAFNRITPGRRRDGYRAAGQHARRRRVRRRARGDRAHGPVGAEHGGDRGAAGVRAAVHRRRAPRCRPGLLQAFWIGIPVFLLMVRDRHRRCSWPTRRCAGSGARSPGCARGCSRSTDDTLGDRLLEGRDRIRREIGPHWQLALGAVDWRAGCSSTACSCSTLCGLSADPDPALVLLAFVAASVLGLIPFTPGGLGFVEAGLAATLAVAGISTGDALVATLVYRLLTFWLPIPLGGIAAWRFRRRHPHKTALPTSLASLAPSPSARRAKPALAETPPTSSRRGGGCWWPTSREPRG